MDDELDLELEYLGEDLYPRDGTYYQPDEPEQQVRDRSKERAKTTAALPLIKDLIIRLENRVKFYDSVASIDTDVLTSPEEFMRQWEVNKLTQSNLKEELEYLMQLRDTYGPQKG